MAERCQARFIRDDWLEPTRCADPPHSFGLHRAPHPHQKGVFVTFEEDEAIYPVERCDCGPGGHTLTGECLPRRCQAYHGQFGIRCEGEVSNAAPHLGDHHARRPDGLTLYWSDSVAVSRETAEALLRGDPPESRASERQVGGNHYRQFKIQPWDIVDEYGLGFYEGNALKYLLRRKADRLEDLKKARHYLDKLIELAEAGEVDTGKE